MATPVSLPPDIWINIVSFCRDNYTLRELAICSMSMYNIAMPVLWETADFSGSDKGTTQLQRILLAVADGNSGGRLLDCLKSIVHLRVRDKGPYTDGERGCMWHFLLGPLQVMQHSRTPFTNVKTLHITADDKFCVHLQGWSEKAVRSLIDCENGSKNLGHFPALKHLSLSTIDHESELVFSRDDNMRSPFWYLSPEERFVEYRLSLQDYLRLLLGIVHLNLQEIKLELGNPSFPNMLPHVVPWLDEGFDMLADRQEPITRVSSLKAIFTQYQAGGTRLAVQRYKEDSLDDS